MGKFIAVTSSYALYEVEDDVVLLLENGDKTTPPLVVLEVLTLSGKARRVGTVGTVTMGTIPQGDEDEEDPPEGAGPWVGGE